jgi:hypothetical protein
MDGELVFIGDAGNAEAGRPSKRHGVEWANHWRADWVASAGVSVPRYDPWSGALLHQLVRADRGQQRARRRADGILQMGYQLARHLRLRLDVFNLFDARTLRQQLPLRVAPAGRAARRRGRPACAPGRAAHLQGVAELRF